MDIVRYDPQELKELQLQRDKEEEEIDSAVTRYATIAFRDIGRLLDQVFGTRYQPQNNFTVIQKQKILDYLFARNVMEGLHLSNNPAKKQFRYSERPDGVTTKERLKQEKGRLEESSDRLDGLFYLRRYVRWMFLNETAYEFNRARYVSMAYGFILGAAINVTLMKFSSQTRKFFMSITLAHVFGQVSVYRNMDFVFDQVYPIFREDAREQIRNGTINNFGKNEMQRVIRTLSL